MQKESGGRGKLARGRGEHPESLVGKGRMYVRWFELSLLPFRHQANSRSCTPYIHLIPTRSMLSNQHTSEYHLARLKRQIFRAADCMITKDRGSATRFDDPQKEALLRIIELDPCMSPCTYKTGSLSVSFFRLFPYLFFHGFIGELQLIR